MSLGGTDQIQTINRLFCFQIVVFFVLSGNRNFSSPYRAVVEEKVSQFLGMSLISQPGPTGMMDKIVVSKGQRSKVKRSYQVKE